MSDKQARLADRIRLTISSFIIQPLEVAFQRWGVTRFDQVALLSLLGLALIMFILIWRGNQIGVQVVAVSPANGATDVSTRTSIQITFDQKMGAVDSEASLSITPPVSGTLRWEEAAITFIPAQALAPDTTYTVTLTGNLQSQPGQSFYEVLPWQFRTRRPRLLYFAPDEQGNDQLFVLSLDGSPPTPLTQEQFGVWDYSLAPDGRTIIFAALRQDNGSDLWEIAADGSEVHQLLICPQAFCSGAVWSPDTLPGTGTLPDIGGRRLIYERRNLLISGATPGPPRLWWLDPARGDTVPVFEDKTRTGYGARWSPDGQWLSYVSPSDQGVQIYNINDHRSFLIPSRMGGMGVWNPQGDSLLITDIRPQEEGFAIHLLRASPLDGQLTDLSGQTEKVEDSSPAWSPDGKWIAFTRKPAGASMGKQIWLMKPDGSEAHYLTNEPEINHGAPDWSPDGRALLYHRFSLKQPGQPPEVWLLDIETGRTQELIAPANRPTWLP